MLEQSFYIRLCIYYILLFCTNGFKTKLKIGLWAWRIGIFYIIFDTLASFFYSENIANKLFLLLSLIHCLIIMPFFHKTVPVVTADNAIIISHYFLTNVVIVTWNINYHSIFFKITLNYSTLLHNIKVILISNKIVSFLFPIG